jgi:hypothetical protein
MPVSIEPPPPSAEQLADWQALIERIRQGDRSQLLAWDEAEAVGTAAAYQVLITQLVTSGCAAHRPCWSARSLASSRSFGWIPPKPA